MDGILVWCEEKKLEDAARYWARGSDSLREAIDDLRRLNAPEDVIREMEKAQASEDFEVWDENWPAVEMWLRLQTQWRTSFGGLIGLDYVAAKWLFQLYEVKDQKEMMDCIIVMERSALSAISEDNANGP